MKNEKIIASVGDKGTADLKEATEVSLKPREITHEEAVNALYLMEITADLVIFETNQKIVHSYINEQRAKDQAHEELVKDYHYDITYMNEVVKDLTKQLEELVRDVKRFMELEEQDTFNSQEEHDEYYVLREKLSKVGK